MCTTLSTYMLNIILYILLHDWCTIVDVNDFMIMIIRTLFYFIVNLHSLIECIHNYAYIQTWDAFCVRYFLHTGCVKRYYTLMNYKISIKMGNDLHIIILYYLTSYIPYLMHSWFLLCIYYIVKNYFLLNDQLYYACHILDLGYYRR